MIQRFILILLLAVGQVYSFAQIDRITNFHVDMEVRPDRSLKVVETITIQNESRGPIKRGLTRNLPNKRMLKDKSMKMRYDITSVKRDGKE